jgi:release factor glutamine methyltransferase
MNVDAALALARRSGGAIDRLDAQLMLAHVLGHPRAWLLAHGDQLLSADQAAFVQMLFARRAAGEPLAYVLGEAQFRGLRLKVTPDVLIPRPETELLVEWALECLPAAPSADVLDLGTGSGAIALAVAASRPAAQLHASDASAAALAVARANAHQLALQVSFAQGPWWQPWAGRRFGLVVANPPYIATADPHFAALAHEPASALVPAGDAAHDGLADLGRIVEGAWAHLLPGAWLLLEHGHDQAEAVRSMLHAAGFTHAETRADLAGLPRCTGARLGAPRPMRGLPDNPPEPPTSSHRAPP